MLTQSLSQRDPAEVEDHECEEDGHHVEDDIPEEGPGGGREGLDHGDAPGHHRGHEHTGTCQHNRSPSGGNIPWPFSVPPPATPLSWQPLVGFSLPKTAPMASPAVRGSEKATTALKTSGAPLPKARKVTPWRGDIKEKTWWPHPYGDMWCLPAPVPQSSPPVLAHHCPPLHHLQLMLPCMLSSASPGTVPRGCRSVPNMSPPFIPPSPPRVPCDPSRILPRCETASGWWRWPISSGRSWKGREGGTEG